MTVKELISVTVVLCFTQISSYILVGARDSGSRGLDSRSGRNTALWN